MDECPHCGEPIEEDAESCQHCGSDFETGWKPDTDYYALELPDDDLDAVDFPQANRGSPWEAALGWSLVITAFGVFVAAGWTEHQTAVMPFALALLACLALFHRMLAPRKATQG